MSHERWQRVGESERRYAEANRLRIPRELHELLAYSFVNELDLIVGILRRDGDALRSGPRLRELEARD